MELFTLDGRFQPDKFVNNYESLIWTERYASSGDFQLVTSNIEEALRLLPLDSYVTLRDTSVPMRVETHKLNNPPGEVPKVEITGRSFEAPALEQRGAVRSLSEVDPWMIGAASESDAAYLAMRTVLGDSAQTQNGIEILPARVPAISSKDAIPELKLIMPADFRLPTWVPTAEYAPEQTVWYRGDLYFCTKTTGSLNETPGVYTDSWDFVIHAPTVSSLNSYSFEIQKGELYSDVISLLNINAHSIKSFRPDESGDQIGIEIYNGADLTEELTFDIRFEQVQNATYLFSKTGSKNVAYLYLGGYAQKVLKTSAEEPGGLDRRVLVLDESYQDNVYYYDDPFTTRARIELYKYNVTALFDAEIADSIAKGYNRDYFLGDILKLVGEYGLSENVRVAEFIRTDDSSGDKAYPTFEAIP